MMFKRPAAAMTLAAAMLVAGCSGNGNAGTSSPVPSSAAPSSASSAPTPSATPSGSAPSAGAPSSPSSSATPPASSSPSASEDPIQRKVDSMSLEEKIGQMILAGVAGTTLSTNDKKMIAEDKIGGVILYANNIKDLNGAVSLINALKKTNVPNPAPLLVGVDQEGGRVNRLPGEFVKMPPNRTVGDAGKPELAGEMGKLIGRELKAIGVNLDFAPVLDVNSNPNNPVIGDRSFGSSASLVASLGLPELEGIRGEGIIPVVKHFPGHGDTSVDSHLDLPVVNKTTQQLAKLEWIPFQAAIKDHVEAVMVAHILFPKLDADKPASLSAEIVGKLLRDQMNYDGVVFTDDLTMGAIVKHYTLAQAAVDAVLAGDDILLVGHGYDDERTVFDTLLAKVKDGTIPESRIDGSAYRILKLKTAFQLHDRSTPVPDLTSINADVSAWLKQVES
ncbi:beta-N-acetylhexosaminidase [Cohnella zeiphila]|uniref:Beta-N-acetylhexosaminidase n=1 Tax=Cohnella zeiphila TaxID=2761120 RepID=A0A7X0SKT8_9BACL|nr:beta-N-acetylhexosaminidase [Cohnella zeiphila]MBB6729588.1 beta-N-acetylhexosaminidase [Cohnella zeiphila]